MTEELKDIIIKRPPGGKFQVGDEVSYGGSVGFLTEHGLKDYPLVLDVGGLYFSFTENGRAHCEHEDPTLSFISRPKQKRIVKMAPALGRWQSKKIYITLDIFENEDAARVIMGEELIRLLWDRAVEVEVDE